MAAKSFLVTGLPRSRTAWMAAFLTTDKTICFHEPLKTMSDISELPEKLKSHSHTYIGASDSGAGYFIQWILKNTKMPILVIDRNLDEVEESAGKLGFPVGNSLQLLSDRLAECRGAERVMWATFESLDNKRIMQKIWWHLMPRIPFDEERFELFKDLRIEADIEKVKHICEVNQVRFKNLMRDVLPLFEARR